MNIDAADKSAKYYKHANKENIGRCDPLIGPFIELHVTKTFQSKLKSNKVIK